MQKKDLLHKIQTDNLLLGLYFGATFVMALYNLFIYFAVKDRGHLIYSGFALTLGLFQLSHQGFFETQYHHFSTDVQNLIHAFLGNCGTFFMLLLVLSFADEQKKQKIFMAVWKIFFALTVFFAVLSFLEYRTVRAAMIWALIAGIFSLYSALRNYRNSGYHRLFFFGLLFAFAGIMTYILKAVDLLIPIITEYGILIGHSSELFIISIALAVKVHELNKNKEKALRQEKIYRLVIKEKEIQHKNLELATIKKVIQPHFLLNSLTFIIRKIKEKPADAVELIKALSHEFHYIIRYSGRDLVPASEEIFICQTHIKVMNLMKKNKYSLESSEFHPEINIPPLLFHTVLENAFSHEDPDSEGFSFQVDHKIQDSDENSGEKKSRETVYSLKVFGRFIKSKNTVPRTGSAYMESRLEESFPGKWKIHSHSIPEGWQTEIRIREDRA
ncbi:MAG: histidine kinase [Spirochaetia bacterium]|nr:histidine kinase [Spirochaetia bacterium]